MDSANAGLWSLYFAGIGEKLVQPGADPLRRPAMDMETSASTTEAYIEARRATRSVDELERELGEKVDRLALICRAMWELVRERNHLSEEDLLDKISEVDLSDGILDGKVRTPQKRCSSCGKVLSRKHMRCYYCGAQELWDSAFDSV